VASAPWRNRLIAEAGERSGEVFEPMTVVFEASADPLPAGLEGPVRLIATTASAEPGTEGISGTIAAHNRK
jgi:hypothetical protein